MSRERGKSASSQRPLKPVKIFATHDASSLQAKQYFSPEKFPYASTKMLTQTEQDFIAHNKQRKDSLYNNPSYDFQGTSGPRTQYKFYSPEQRQPDTYSGGSHRRNLSALEHNTGGLKDNLADQNFLTNEVLPNSPGPITTAGTGMELLRLHQERAILARATKQSYHRTAQTNKGYGTNQLDFSLGRRKKAFSKATFLPKSSEQITPGFKSESSYPAESRIPERPPLKQAQHGKSFDLFSKQGLQSNSSSLPRIKKTMSRSQTPGPAPTGRMSNAQRPKLKPVINAGTQQRLQHSSATTNLHSDN